MRARPFDHRRRIEARLGLGGGAGSDRLLMMPSVVTALLAAIAFVSFLCFLPTGFGRQLDLDLAFIPARFLGGIQHSTGALGVVVPLVGHVFVHGNFGHLALNAVGLAVFGTGVARRLGVEASRPRARLWNTTLFLAFFLASGVAGALFFTLFNAGSAVMLVGASGAISGLMAAAMRFALRPFAPYGLTQGPLARAGARPVLVASFVYIGLNLLTATGLSGMPGAGLEIAWEAHVGGYLFGLFAFPAFDRLARRRSLAGPFAL